MAYYYEPTAIPAQTVEEGLSVVLNPSAINQILLRVCLLPLAEPVASEGDDRPDWVKIVVDSATDITGFKDEMIKAVADNAEVERFAVTGNGCSRFYNAAIAVCMAAYAVENRCISLLICDEESKTAGTSIGHSKGFCLRKQSLEHEHRGFSGNDLLGAITERQKVCGSSAPAASLGRSSAVLPPTPGAAGSP